MHDGIEGWMDGIGIRRKSIPIVYSSIIVRTIAGGKSLEMEWASEMEEKLEYIQKMLDYNIGDIVTTEEIFLKLRKYLGTEINMNMLQGGTDKWRCPWTGSEEVQLDRVTSTKAGTMQYIMRGEEGQYKISQRDYNKFMEYKLDKIGSDE